MSTELREHDEMLLARIHRLIDTLIDNHFNYHKRNFGTTDIRKIAFDIVPGVKYYKLILKDSGTSVHAFINKQSGAVYKPASWKAPAKHVRYNLLDDVSFESCLKRADWAGGYLYIS
jgi:hypothetical protein